MAGAPSPVTAAGGAEGATTGAQLSLEQLAAQVAAIDGAVHTMQTNFDQSLKSLTENVSKIASQIAEQTTSGFQTQNAGVYDPYDAARQTNAHIARVNAYCEQMLANAVEISKAISYRGLDHFSALPPVSPRSPSGPGSVDAKPNA